MTAHALTIFFDRKGEPDDNALWQLRHLDILASSSEEEANCINEALDKIKEAWSAPGRVFERNTLWVFDTGRNANNEVIIHAFEQSRMCRWYIPNRLKVKDFHIFALESSAGEILANAVDRFIDSILFEVIP